MIQVPLNVRLARDGFTFSRLTSKLVVICGRPSLECMFLAVQLMVQLDAENEQL